MNDSTIKTAEDLEETAYLIKSLIQQGLDDDAVKELQAIQQNAIQATLAGQAAQNAELVKDKERLELILSGLSFIVAFDGTKTLYHSISGAVIGQGETPRQAIDTAIVASQPEPKKEKA